MFKSPVPLYHFVMPKPPRANAKQIVALIIIWGVIIAGIIGFSTHNETLILAAFIVTMFCLGIALLLGKAIALFHMVAPVYSKKRFDTLTSQKQPQTARDIRTFRLRYGAIAVAGGVILLFLRTISSHESDALLLGGSGFVISGLCSLTLGLFATEQPLRGAARQKTLNVSRWFLMTYIAVLALWSYVLPPTGIPLTSYAMGGWMILTLSLLSIPYTIHRLFFRKNAVA